jgi:uncharacterized protein (TIGR02186 family)
MTPRRAAVLGVLVCGASLVRADGPGAGPGSAPVTIEPARVEIGLLYSGADLTVSAETEPGVEVAVLVSGPPSELVMREQARRWGLFWAPAGEVTFEDVPSLYLLETTVEAEELAPTHVLEELGIGYASLRTRLGEETRHDLVRELIVLKESEGLFSSTVAKNDDREAPVAGGPVYRTVVHIPARAPAGTYSVQLCTFREGHLVSRSDRAFELEQAGFVAFVSSLAETHGLAYGVFAVVVAVASGLLVGFVFGSTRKKT